MHTSERRGYECPQIGDGIAGGCRAAHGLVQGATQPSRAGPDHRDHDRLRRPLLDHPGRGAPNHRRQDLRPADQHRQQDDGTVPPFAAGGAGRQPHRRRPALEPGQWRPRSHEPGRVHPVRRGLTFGHPRHALCRGWPPLTLVS